MKGDDSAASHEVEHITQSAAHHALRQLLWPWEPLDRTGEIGICGGVACEAPHHRHHAVEPQLKKRGQRRATGCGDLKHHNSSTRPYDPNHLDQAALQVREVSRPEPYR